MKRIFIFFFTLLFIIFFSSTVFAATESPIITSPAAILMDSFTGTILYQKNIDQRMYPASTTKIMTAILTIENCDLNDNATASYNAIHSVPEGYSVGDIKVDETLKIRNLLEVLLVYSANDAAYILAEHVGGSVENFAEMMIKKAEEIGCTNTHFVNPSGKHDVEHYSCAKDLALIMRYCMKNNTFREIASLRSCTLPETAYSPERKFNTTVELLIPDDSDSPTNYYYPYAIAGKTGFTSEAKNCLVSTSKKDDLELTSVILGSNQTDEGYSARFIETKAIYDYGFSNFSMEKIALKGDVVQDLYVKGGTEETKYLTLTLSEDVSVLTNNSIDLKTIKPSVKLVDNLKAPINANDIIGTASYTVGGITYTYDLIASHSVIRSNTFKYIKYAIIILVIIAVIISIILVVRWMLKPRRKSAYKIE